MFRNENECPIGIAQRENVTEKETTDLIAIKWFNILNWRR